MIFLAKLTDLHRVPRCSPSSSVQSSPKLSLFEDYTSSSSSVSSFAWRSDLFFLDLAGAEIGLSPGKVWIIQVHRFAVQSIWDGKQSGWPKYIDGGGRVAKGAKRKAALAKPLSLMCTTSESHGWDDRATSLVPMPLEWEMFFGGKDSPLYREILTNNRCWICEFIRNNLFKYFTIPRYVITYLKHYSVFNSLTVFKLEKYLNITIFYHYFYFYNEIF